NFAARAPAAGDGGTENQLVGRAALVCTPAGTGRWRSPESRQARWRRSSSELLIGIEALEYRALARRTMPGTMLGQPHQRLFHRGQRADLFLHVGNFRFRDRPHFASIALVIDAEGQQLPDLRQGKAELLSALDEAHAPYGGLGVDSIAGRQARRL